MRGCRRPPSPPALAAAPPAPRRANNIILYYIILYYIILYYKRGGCRLPPSWGFRPRRPSRASPKVALSAPPRGFRPHAQHANYIILYYIILHYTMPHAQHAQAARAMGGKARKTLNINRLQNDHERL